MERNKKTARREKDKDKESQETDSVETEGLSETKWSRECENFAMSWV